MLKGLFIRNYALINELEINFQTGLTILSGETGAGKSIILGALSLILGQRADSQALLDKTKKCIVEGTFDIRNYDLENFFEKNDLDFESLTRLRREINIAGKSRAFINDTPVNLILLKELGMRLVDIHSQHQNMLLGQNQFQLKVVDDFCSHFPLLDSYRKEFISYKELEKEYFTLKEKNDQAHSDLDYYTFQFDQLEKAALEAGEQILLEEEQNRLTHSEEISTSLTKIARILDGADDNLLLRVREIRQMLEKVKSYYSKAIDLFNRFESVEIELSDLRGEIENDGLESEHDPGRLESIRERLNLLYGLEQKHHVDNVEDLIRQREQLKMKIEGLFSEDSKLATLGNLLVESKAVLRKKAGELSQDRLHVLPRIEKEVAASLHKLGIPHGQFKVKHTLLNEITINGIDQVDFLFTANKRTPLLDLKKVASGGELSRVMLSLKSLIRRTAAMPTIIFDEIDSGVSGDIADLMGEIIAGMASTMQVINITHLPQIASKGNQHFLVYKTEENKVTQTFIRLLNPEERVQEIAKMLSGKELTQAAVENAKVLLGLHKS